MLKEGKSFYLLLVLGIYTIYLSHRLYDVETKLNALLRTNSLATTSLESVEEDHSLRRLTTIARANMPGGPRSAERAMERQHQQHHVSSAATLSTTSMRYVLHNKSPAPKVSPRLEKAQDRTIYGGVIDMPHLGGFTEQDNNTIAPNTWNFLMSEIAVKSMVDVGCGRGISSKYFLDRGVDVLCVEGSHDALDRSYLPKSRIVQHDFTLGPWWPETTYDFAWSTEFLEHVGRQYMDHYLPIFMKSALVMVTTSGWGGWHHVEVHAPWWWIARFEARGFVYSPQLTQLIQGHAKTDQEQTNQAAQVRGMMVFINPAVASLPRHKHLLGGKGCYSGSVDNENGGQACTGVDELPVDYKSILECKRRFQSEPAEQYITIPWECNHDAAIAAAKSKV